MKLFNKIVLSHVTLDSKNYHDKFKTLRKYLQSKYHIDYMTSYIITSEPGKNIADSIKEIEGNTTINISLLNIGNIPRVIYNRNVLIDSKKKGIKARFIIPFYVNNIKHIIIIEAKRENTIIGKEELIYRDIITFKNIINNSSIY